MMSATFNLGLTEMLILGVVGLIVLGVPIAFLVYWLSGKSSDNDD